LSSSRLANCARRSTGVQYPQSHYKSSYVSKDDAVIGLVSAKQSKISLSEEFGTKETIKI
jgi:hypothetical protein